MVTLRRCTGCGHAYYCSRECQVKQWKEHKPHCRKKGDYRPDDTLKLDYLVAHRDHNGELVRAVEQVNSGRWIVEILSRNGQKLSVKTENLEHIRPPA
jgi:hypothetical protein